MLYTLHNGIYRLLVGATYVFLALAALLLTGCGGGGTATTASAPPPAASGVAKPVGVFTASGAQNDAVLAHPQVRGALIRVPWDTVEPSPGSYNWTMINSVVSKTKAAGKKWSLAVLAGPATPGWIYQAPYNVPRIRYLFRGVEKAMAPAWNATVRERLRLLAQALTAQFGSDPDLQLVYVTQMTANGIEGQLPPDRDLLPAGTAWASLGWTADGWVEAITGTARDFAGAFPGKALAVELHYVLNDATIPRRIGDSLCADASLAGRVGIAMWWLSGRTTYQPDLIDYFRNVTCDKYGQVIAPSSDPSQFPPEGYGAMFAQAKELRLRYFEPWEQEFTTLCCQWDIEFAGFNAWATSTFGG